MSYALRKRTLVYQLDPVQTTKTSVHGAINMLGLPKRLPGVPVSTETIGWRPCATIEMIPEELLELIRQGENSGVEFKRDDLRREQLAREVVALANF